MSVVRISSIIEDCTFLPPPTTKYIRVTNIGGGGAGGGLEFSSATQVGGGGGGGGGGAAVIFTAPYIPMANVVYTSTLNRFSVVTYSNISSLAGYGSNGSNCDYDVNLTGFGAGGGAGGTGSCTLSGSLVYNGCNGFAGGCYASNLSNQPSSNSPPWYGYGLLGGIINTGISSIGGGGMGGGSGLGGGGGGGGGTDGINAGATTGVLTGAPGYGGGGGGAGGGIPWGVGQSVATPSSIGGPPLLIIECIQ
jgi:hypothetical protein